MTAVSQPQLPRRLQPLVMLMTSRTGSSLLTEVLNLHPRILFEPEMFNGPSSWLVNGSASKFLSGGHIAAYKRYKAHGPREYTKPAKDDSQLAVVGFKVRPSAANLGPGTPAWSVLEQARPKIICSYRRNAFKAALSQIRALQLVGACGIANVVRDINCSLPDPWYVSTNRFKEELAVRLNTSSEFMSLCYKASETFHTMFVAYEDLLADLAGTVHAVLQFTGLPAADREPFVAAIREEALPILTKKNTPDDLALLLTEDNLQGLRAAAAETYSAWSTSNRLLVN